MTSREEILNHPTVPFEAENTFSIGAILEKMEKISFQGRTLGKAWSLWKKMIETPGTTIFLGLAGAMVPAGMRKILASLITHRFVDIVVSTGANLYHDLYETAGFSHYIANKYVSDAYLREQEINRVYDTYCDDRKFDFLDQEIGKWAEQLAKNHPYPLSTREFFYFLGEWANSWKKEEGILTTAYRKNVPIYCPAIGDSSFGIALVQHLRQNTGTLHLDVLKDVYEMAHLASVASFPSVVFIGGGTPKNFTQQAEVVAKALGKSVTGYHFALQITQDVPFWGGLSGCTFDESTSWGKISPDAEKVMLHCDATIALPLLGSALMEYASRGFRRKVFPTFTPGSRELRVNVRVEQTEGKNDGD